MPKITLEYQAFNTILEEYLTLDEFKTLSNLTISAKRIALASLLNHLGDNEITNLQDCLQKHVTSHLCSIATLSSSTISGRCFIFRHFFNYLYYQGITPYSVEEIKKVTSAVNRNTLSGKRDLAILLLAAELGMRSGDICRLKIDDIHWERNTIEFIQYKTKVFNQLPLLENIKYALIDYLKNVRPSCKYTNIFIGIKNGYAPLSNSSIHSFISKYFVKANIDISERKHGPHAMRHSLASNLLSNNTPMHVIKEVLGHTNLNTTQIYLSIDIDLLKRFALEVPYETTC